MIDMQYMVNMMRLSRDMDSLLPMTLSRQGHGAVGEALLGDRLGDVNKVIGHCGKPISPEQTVE